MDHIIIETGKISLKQLQLLWFALHLIWLPYQPLTLVLLNPDIPCLNSVDPDQLASLEAN